LLLLAPLMLLFHSSCTAHFSGILRVLGSSFSQLLFPPSFPQFLVGSLIGMDLVCMLLEVISSPRFRLSSSAWSPKIYYSIRYCCARFLSYQAALQCVLRFPFKSRPSLLWRRECTRTRSDTGTKAHTHKPLA